MEPNSHAKVNYDDVTVRRFCTIKDIFRSGVEVKLNSLVVAKGRDLLQVTVNNTIIMKVFDTREDGVNDGRGIPFCEFSFLHNSFEQLSTDSQLKRQIVFGS